MTEAPNEMQWCSRKPRDWPRNSIPHVFETNRKLCRVAAHAAEAMELNEHRESGSVALGGEPELNLVHVAVAASTPNSANAIRAR